MGGKEGEGKDSAIIVSITGRQHDVDVLYSAKVTQHHPTSPSQAVQEWGTTPQACAKHVSSMVGVGVREQSSINYIQSAVETVLQIVKSEGPGDILVFLPGMEVSHQLPTTSTDDTDRSSDRRAGPGKAPLSPVTCT